MVNSTQVVFQLLKTREATLTAQSQYKNTENICTFVSGKQSPREVSVESNKWLKMNSEIPCDLCLSTQKAQDQYSSLRHKMWIGCRGDNYKTNCWLQQYLTFDETQCSTLYTFGMYNRKALSAVNNLARLFICVVWPGSILLAPQMNIFILISLKWTVPNSV